MKLIFLDVDGVLNSTETDVRAPSGVIGVEDDKLLRLKQIVDQTGAKVVLTSTWKTDYYPGQPLEDMPSDGQYLLKKLQEHKIPLIGKTEDPAWHRRGRGILDFINHFPQNVESFVILDDERFDFEYEGIDDKHIKTFFTKRTVQTLLGLQDYHIEKAVSILNASK